MSSAVGRELIDINQTGLVDAPACPSVRWEQWPASRIAHHGAACCDAAREWVLAFDYSQLNAGDPLTGPRWLRHKFKWGPSGWPMHWCEAARRETLDCGALASLTQEIFTARGVRNFPAQLVQQYSHEATRHWMLNWEGEQVACGWISDDTIYHEACAVVTGGDEIRVWDPTASWWVNPKQFGGYGGLLALRILDPAGAAPAALKWGSHGITPNRWHQIERARPDFA
jgi:hypothetical protein